MRYCTVLFTVCLSALLCFGSEGIADLPTGDVEPNSGDFVFYSAEDEQKHLGDKWQYIDGIEVNVVSAMFTDATTWQPRRGVSCRTTFLNDNYQKEMARRQKVTDAKLKALRKKWNKDHPDNRIDDPQETK